MSLQTKAIRGFLSNVETDVDAAQHSLEVLSASLVSYATVSGQLRPLELLRLNHYLAMAKQEVDRLWDLAPKGSERWK